MIKFFVVLLGLLLAGCGGGGTEPAREDDDAPVLFHFKMRGLPDQDFRAIIANKDAKAKARAQLALPEAQRNLFATGLLGRTNGGYNLNWSWHFEGGVGLIEASIELCDASPRLIEEHLDLYISQPYGVCPWGSYVYAELGPA